MLILDHNIPQTAGYRVRFGVMVEPTAHEKLSGFIIIQGFKCQIAPEHVQTCGIYNGHKTDIYISKCFAIITHIYENSLIMIVVGLMLQRYEKYVDFYAVTLVNALYFMPVNSIAEQHMESMHK